MKKITMKQVKLEVKTLTNIELDFRTHVFIDNDYSNIPLVGYNEMHEIVLSLFDIFKLDICCHNSGMMLNQLKSNTLKNMIDNLIFLNNNNIL